MRGILRIFFRRDRRLLDIPFQTVAQTLLDWFISKNKSEHITFGIVSGLHTFDRDLKWNPHIHILVTEGACGNRNAWRDFKHAPYSDFNQPDKVANYINGVC